MKLKKRPLQTPKLGTVSNRGVFWGGGGNELYPVLATAVGIKWPYGNHPLY